MTNDAVAVEAMAKPELESLIAAKKVLVGGYALHVAVEEHAQAVAKPIFSNLAAPMSADRCRSAPQFADERQANYFDRG